MRTEALFNDNWEFLEAKADGTDFSDLKRADGWRGVDLPHDFLIADAREMYRECDGWYKKRFSFNKRQGERTFLRFDGVYMDSTVWLNGETLGEWENGSTAFTLDASDLIKDGENELVLRCKIRTPNARWYAGGGIYRNVYLVTVDERHIKENGVYISTEKAAHGYELRVSVEATGDVEIVHTVLDESGNEIAVFRGGENQSRFIEAPAEWSPESPRLYTLLTRLYAKGELTDAVETRFGFRSVKCSANDGFFLNGRRFKLRGMCLHGDLGALGAAVNRAAIERQLRLVKEMGANAVRTAHHPFSPEFYELCDEMGLLVMSEFADVWRKPKNPYDYARFFDACHEKDMASFIRTARNHPSVIMWSLGNEIYDTHAGEEGLFTMKKLMALAKKHDPNENARATICSNYMAWENTQRCAEVIKLIGYNYGEKYYAEHHRAHPDWIILGSETASLAQSRGIYHFPLSQSVLSDDDNQCSALGNSRTSWGAKSAEQCVINDRDADFSLGQFVWSGFDYNGEPTPYHSKTSFMGLIDTAGFPKDPYYIFKAAWTDYKREPFVHLFPYWDFSKGQIIDLRAATNAPEVELFVNGVSLGRQIIDHAHGTALLGDWRAEYVVGRIEAVAYDEEGREIARDTRLSFKDAHALKLTPNNTLLKADGRDLIFVEISALDCDGNPVENATNRVEVSVSGAGRLVGIDNGDSADYDSYKGTNMRLFSGKLLAIVAAATTAGEITLTASSRGLKSASVSIISESTITPSGVSAVEFNRESSCIDEIPIRKIELSCERQALDENNRTSVVRAKTSPENATYGDLSWRITNDAGIASPVAAFKETADGIELTALGDGDFRVRCGSKNGRETLSLYSSLEFSARGLGGTLLDPYGYISGGLYSLSGGEITNGNERGFATSRDGVSFAGFEGINFGAFGSNEITLDVFCLDSEPLPIEIWRGVPDESGSRLLLTALYHKPSVWNTYQPETYVLNERVRGIETFCFRLPRKAHIKGFFFSKQEKAFSLLYAAENDGISGDSYTVNDKTVTGIGNNVSLTFTDMDFGGRGAERLIISGKTPLAVNSIQVRFKDESGNDFTELAEFTKTESYAEQEFSLRRAVGKNEVSFVFLPGCDFDFNYFKFI